MAKEREERNNKSFKGKKPFNKDKRKPEDKGKDTSFKRYRDESQPADFGTRPKRTFTDKKKFGDNPFFKGKKEEDTERVPFGNDERETKPFTKKPFDRKNNYKTSKPSLNPNDIDDRDLEYGKEKKTFGNKGGKRFDKPKRFTKDSFSKSKPAAKPKQDKPEGAIRLNRFLANAGIASRREADQLIASGVVQVNGKTVTEMGFQVMPTDVVKYGGQTLRKERLVYLILNKPKDYITTLDDPDKRKTVFDLIKDAGRERIYPVGRLDRNTTGLLMFTNDGELTKKLTHPRYGVRKIYHVELDKPLKPQDLKAITDGIELEDGEIKVDTIDFAGDGKDKTQIGVEIHSGKNRIIRRIFEHFGYNVRKLDRTMFGSLTKKDLSRGRWRFLTESEIGMLHMISAK